VAYIATVGRQEAANRGLKPCFLANPILPFQFFHSWTRSADKAKRPVLVSPKPASEAEQTAGRASQGIVGEITKRARTTPLPGL
jgi:hypothetical protein